MHNLKIFEFENQDVRTLTIDDEPYFVGKDVANILGYRSWRQALIDHVDEEDRGVTRFDTLDGPQILGVIDEFGLYRLILSSKLAKAKKFKQWVTSKVLPAIRQER